MIIINNEESDLSGKVIISAPGYDSVITEIQLIKRGAHKYTVYAPVVYPNFGISPEYRGVYHRPVLATVELKIGFHSLTKKVIIGRFRPWTIYVCQDVCTDFTFGYSENETKELSIKLTDEHLRIMENTDKEEIFSQNRWNINQTMEVMWYLEKKSPEEIERFFFREKDGHIQISPIFNSCLTALMTTEQAIRALYFGRKLEREYGIDTSTVEHIELPTIAWGMSSIFAGSGIKYFVKGWLDYQAPFCAYRDDIPLYFWEGPDGSKILVACDKGASQYANYAQASFLLKDYEDAVKELHEWWIPHFEQRTNYPYDAFILLGSHGDLRRESPEEVNKLVSNIIRYNKEPWEYPRIINANWRMFFKHVEEFIKKYNITVPVLRGDYGCSWEEWPAAMASVVSGMRRGVQRFITAEKLVALTSLIMPEIYERNISKLNNAMLLMEMLPEHAWNGNPSRPGEDLEAFYRKNRWQIELNKLVDEIIEDGLNTLGKMVSTSDRYVLLVFNPLSWERNDIAQIDLSEVERAVGLGSYKIIDESTNEEVPWEILDLRDRKVLRIEAKNLPSIGYKTYSIQLSDCENKVESQVTVEDYMIENRYYRVEIDPSTGGLQSIFDKQRNLELVDKNSPYKVNQYIYFSDGKEHRAHLIKVSRGPVDSISGSLIIETSTLRSQIRTTITLYSNIDRIDIVNEVKKVPSSENTQIYFVFPFNVSSPTYRYEATGAIIKPGLSQYGGEQLAGSGQTSHACISFVDVSNNDYGITLAMIDSYLIQFGHPTTFEMPTRPDASNSTIFALVMANKNYRETVKDQGGVSDFIFRYSIRSYCGNFSGHSSIRFGWERNNDLLVKMLPPNQEGILPYRTYSFLSCKPENIAVTAIKVSDEGLKEGIIIRLWETDGKEDLAVVDASFFRAKTAIKTDLLERDLEDLKMEKGRILVPIKSRSYATIRLLKTP
jgi:alpha-mannosidase